MPLGEVLLCLTEGERLQEASEGCLAPAGCLWAEHGRWPAGLGEIDPSMGPSPAVHSWQLWARPYDACHAFWLQGPLRHWD